MRERLDFKGARSARLAAAIARGEDPDGSYADILVVLTEQYILNGVESWTLVDEKGKSLPVTKPNLRSILLANDEAANDVAEAADEQFSAQVLGPLVVAESTSSPPGPMDDSTSATKNSGTPSPKPSSQSSTSTTPTGGTGTITSLPGGASRSSRRPASVA